MLEFSCSFLITQKGIYNRDIKSYVSIQFMFLVVYCCNSYIIISQSHTSWLRQQVNYLAFKNNIRYLYIITHKIKLQTHAILWYNTESLPLIDSPPKSSIGVDNPEGVKRSVHGLAGREEILDDRYTEVGDQTTQADVVNPPYVATCKISTDINSY